MTRRFPAIFIIAAALTVGDSATAAEEDGNSASKCLAEGTGRRVLLSGTLGDLQVMAELKESAEQHISGRYRYATRFSSLYMPLSLKGMRSADRLELIEAPLDPSHRPSGQFDVKVKCGSVVQIDGTWSRPDGKGDLQVHLNQVGWVEEKVVPPSPGEIQSTTVQYPQSLPSSPSASSHLSRWIENAVSIGPSALCGDAIWPTWIEVGLLTLSDAMVSARIGCNEDSGGKAPGTTVYRGVVIASSRSGQSTLSLGDIFRSDPDSLKRLHAALTAFSSNGRIKVQQGNHILVPPITASGPLPFSISPAGLEWYFEEANEEGEPTQGHAVVIPYRILSPFLLDGPVSSFLTNHLKHH